MNFKTFNFNNLPKTKFFFQFGLRVRYASEINTFAYIINICRNLNNSQFNIHRQIQIIFIYANAGPFLCEIVNKMKCYEGCYELLLLRHYSSHFFFLQNMLIYFKYTLRHNQVRWYSLQILSSISVDASSNERSTQFTLIKQHFRFLIENSFKAKEKYICSVWNFSSNNNCSLDFSKKCIIAFYHHGTFSLVTCVQCYFWRLLQFLEFVKKETV